MDVKLLEQLRRATPAILNRWQRECADAFPDAGGAMRGMTTGLLPLLLDSLQFEGFAELDHFAARAGEAAWAGGARLGSILACVFHLRAVLREYVSGKAKSAQTGACQGEIDAEFDRFAAACAQAYVQACERGAVSQSQRQAEQLAGALDALDSAVMILDADLHLQVHNAALAEMLELPAAPEGRSIGEITDKETAAILRGLIEEAASGNGRVAGALEMRKGQARASVVPLTVAGETLFLVEVKVQPADHAGAASVLREMLTAHGDGPIFGRLMKELRKQKGISMRALAERLQMARGYISNIESGKALPSFNAITQICEILDPDGRQGLLVLGIVQRIPDQVRKKLIS